MTTPKKEQNPDVAATPTEATATPAKPAARRRVKKKPAPVADTAPQDIAPTDTPPVAPDDVVVTPTAAVTTPAKATPRKRVKKVAPVADVVPQDIVPTDTPASVPAVQDDARVATPAAIEPAVAEPTVAAPPIAEPVKKRTIAKLAASNFRATWRQSFAGMRPADFMLPKAQQLEPNLINWPWIKSVGALLGAAVIGGSVGMMGYGLPFVFPLAVIIAAPFVGAGVSVRGLGLLLPKGDLKDSIKKIGNKALVAGGLIFGFPMLAVAAPAFVGLHAALTAGEALAQGGKASLQAALLTVQRRDIADAPAPQPTDAPQRGWNVEGLGDRFKKALSRQKTPAPVTPDAAPPAPQVDTPSNG